MIRVRRWVRCALVMVVTLAGPLTRQAAAQDRPPPVAEIAGGALLFADDGVVTEPYAGGALRVYVTPRLSVGPEIAAVSGRNHSHTILTGNLTFDVRAPLHGQPRRVTPFVVAGAGVFTTRERFSHSTFTSSEGAFTAGGGLRGWVSDKVVVGVEARVGWELHVRVNAMVGVRLK